MSYDKAYDTIIKCLNDAAEANITKRTFCKHRKSYWATEVKELHDEMRKPRAIWIRNGIPKTNTVSRQNYKNAKCKFRRLLRLKNRDYEREKMNELITWQRWFRKGFGKS